MTHIIVALVLLSACSPQEQAPAVDGVYTLCKEVTGYSGETLELKGGKFRYWFYSDVRTDKEPKYPLTGTFTLSGTALTLDSSDVHSGTRTVDKVNGVPVLWRKDGLELWQKEKRLHPYAVLIRIDGATEGSARPERPSLDLLMTKEMRDRDKKEHEERYSDLPPESRALFRAKTQEGDRHRESYKQAIAQARVQPDPKLVGQLVGLLNHESEGIRARGILGDLYGSSWLIKEPPPFVKDPKARKQALEALIDGLSHAKDRYCLENALLVFLRASDTRSIDLEVPEAGITIKLSVQGTDGYTSDSRGTPRDDIVWKKLIAKLIPPCQDWMRTQLSK
jgi:hypothetical protein